MVTGEWQLCPLCQGVGQVSGGYFNRAGDNNQWASATAMESCRICSGVGLLKRPLIDEGRKE